MTSARSTRPARSVRRLAGIAALAVVVASAWPPLAANATGAPTPPDAAPTTTRAGGSATASPSARPTVTPTPTAPPMATPAPRPTATPTATPAPAPTADPAAAAAAPPVLTVRASVDRPTVVTAGQRVTYTVAVTNTGVTALKDTVVALVATGLPPLTCAPVAQGGTLAAGASTTCTGSRSVDQADLRTRGARFSATAAGQAPDGSAVTATATSALTTRSVPPVVTNDSVTVAAGTTSVDLPASTNDGPGQPGGPVLDLSRTLLQGTSTSSDPDSRRRTTTGGTWEVLADGSVRFTPVAQGAGRSNAVGYLTYDASGHSSTGTLTVVVGRAPLAKPDTARTAQGVALDLDVLSNDVAGQTADAEPATLDRSSIRFPDRQPVAYAEVAPGRTQLTVPRAGRFEVEGDRIRFTPAPTFATTATEPLTIAYSVTDTVGNVATSTVTITVTPVRPTVTDVSATTTYGEHVDVEWASHAAPADVSFGGFVSRDGSGVDSTTWQGSWYYSAGPPRRTYVTFFPAQGFAGTASTLFQVVDANGTTATATMRVTVRRPGSARADVATTRPGVDVTVDPLANDTPSQHLDGTVGRFDLRRLVFSESAQPEGATLADQAKTLLIPGRGTAWISNGKVTFRPQAGFAGYVGRLSLDVDDDSSDVNYYPYKGLVDAIAVLVTSSGPTATDDVASTVLDRAVTLPGSTNDDPGTAVRPLPTTFPRTGQPSGSTVSTNGRTLQVPGQGAWVINPSGSVTFTPARGFVDGTSPVLYSVVGAGGASATASLTVTVQPGPYAASDVITQPQSLDGAYVDPIVNDSPGRNADGTLGTIDPLSIRFPVSGQPGGAQPTGDSGLNVPAHGSVPAFSIFTDSASGQVYVDVYSPFRGALPTVSYTVADSVTDSTGAVVHHRSTATLQVVFIGTDPVATDDRGTINPAETSSVVLPGATNDVPGSNYVDSLSFPRDQLSGLPRGSTIELVDTGAGYAGWTARVPGEGVWTTDPLYETIAFHTQDGFTGLTTPLRYLVVDHDGGSDEATVQVSVLPLPTLRADIASTRQGVPVTLAPLANDEPGRTVGGQSVALDPDALVLGPEVPKGTVFTTSGAGREAVVPGEGRYSIANATGLLTFTPDKTFAGTTSPIEVQELGSRSTLRITVTRVTPAANPDAATVGRSTSTRVPVLDDDEAGAAAAPLVPSTLRFSAAGVPAGVTRTSDGQVLSVPGRGVLAVAGDGTVGWYPASTVTGTLPSVTYEVKDTNGTRTTALLDLTVR